MPVLTALPTASYRMSPAVVVPTNGAMGRGIDWAVHGSLVHRRPINRSLIHRSPIHRGVERRTVDRYTVDRYTDDGGGMESRTTPTVRFGISFWRCSAMSLLANIGWSDGSISDRDCGGRIGDASRSPVLGEASIPPTRIRPPGVKGRRLRGDGRGSGRRKKHRLLVLA